LAGTQSEAGSYVVLRGRPDGFHQYVGDPALTPRFPNGDVGVRIRFENNVDGSGQVNLFVEQKVDGLVTSYGSPVNIPAAGWYRILLCANGPKVSAIIGGTFGDNNDNDTLAGGIRIDDTTSLLRQGGIGMNYHTPLLKTGEVFTDLRPLTYDNLTFRAPTLITSLHFSRPWKLVFFTSH
jgi:hypothetical protein